MEQMPRRVENVSEYLARIHGVKIVPESADEELDRIPALIGAVGTFRPLTDEEFELSLVGARPKAIPLFRSILPREILTGETHSMIFDAGLLWGEAFRHRYPDAFWAIGSPPKNSVDYGDPVIRGKDKYQAEFGVLGEMISEVGLTIKGKLDRWPLSKTMKVRAFELDLGPDPR